MTKFMALAKQDEENKISKSITKRQRPIGNYIIIGLVMLVGLSYLIFVNKVATDGYQVKALTEKVEQLNDQNKKLELESSNLKSMISVSQVSQNLQLVSINDMDYLSTSTGAVAYK